VTPGDVVEILSGDHVGHLGVVLDLHPNGLVGVACGTGTAGRDDTHYVIRARERFGLRMGLPKDTYFYQSRGIAWAKPDQFKSTERTAPPDVVRELRKLHGLV